MKSFKNVTAYVAGEGLKKTTLTFDEQYKYALLWSNGQTQKVALNNHTLTVSNAAGAAVFVIPY